jgi:hypothetical protein
MTTWRRRLRVTQRRFILWEYAQWPKVEAAVPLTDDGTDRVYREAMRWGREQVIVRWLDDEEHAHVAWIPAANVRRLTVSEWDSIAYHQCPPELRSTQWGKRLPGFLPE